MTRLQYVALAFLLLFLGYIEIDLAINHPWSHWGGAEVNIILAGTLCMFAGTLLERSRR